MYRHASSSHERRGHSTSVSRPTHTTESWTAMAEYPGTVIPIHSSPPIAYQQPHSQRPRASSNFSDPSNSSHSASSSGQWAPTTARTSVHPSPIHSNYGDTTHYSFRQVDFNSMKVVRTPESEDQAPVYSITVLMNCFMPLSSVTRVTRGAPGEGPVVGEFETGISSIEGRIHFERDGKGSRNLTDIFKRLPGSKFSREKSKNWEWHRGPFRLAWEKSSKANEYTCYTHGEHTTPLAKLRWVVGGSPATVTLEVTNSSHELFDDIIVSALLVEQRRRCPMEGDENRALFN
ncbi:hypothetical protein QCA50_002157 [Cerrena zonata]|uniref:DUF6593 domain-containing protein n=1 Tax=Cerrena zonata TaxID=2478898 RepID=A0AAW0GUZ3_9APHY